MLCGLFSGSPRLEQRAASEEDDIKSKASDDDKSSETSTKSNSSSTNSRDNSPKSPPRSPTIPNTTLSSMIGTTLLHPDLITNFATTLLNAELILFLHATIVWRFQWTGPLHNWNAAGQHAERVKCYAHAALIYYSLVDEGADYPVNIHPRRRRKLGEVFRWARWVDGGTGDVSLATVESDGDTLGCGTLETTTSRSATPWEGDSLHLNNRSSRVVTQKAMTEVPINASEAVKKIQVLPAHTTERLMTAREDSAMEVEGATIDKPLDAPPGMDLTVFDEAIKEVKMQAYHNVWLPYVQSEEYRKFMASECVWID